MNQIKEKPVVEVEGKKHLNLKYLYDLEWADEDEAETEAYEEWCKDYDLNGKFAIYGIEEIYEEHGQFDLSFYFGPECVDEYGVYLSDTIRCDDLFEKAIESEEWYEADRFSIGASENHHEIRANTESEVRELYEKVKSKVISFHNSRFVDGEYDG